MLLLPLSRQHRKTRPLAPTISPNSTISSVSFTTSAACFGDDGVADSGGGGGRRRLWNEASDNDDEEEVDDDDEGDIGVSSFMVAGTASNCARSME